VTSDWNCNLHICVADQKISRK